METNIQTITFWNSLTYDKDHYEVFNKKTICGGIIAAGVVVPIIIPIPLCILIAGIICFLHKEDLIKIPKKLLYFWRRESK